MTSQRNLGILSGISLALKLFPIETALIMNTIRSIQLISACILLKASCDKYRTPLKNAFVDGSDGTHLPAE